MSYMTSWLAALVDGLFNRVAVDRVAVGAEVPR
jgi:hypothetical protein